MTFWALALGAAALGGCVVGPSYRTPDRASTAPAAFAEQGAHTSAVAPPGRWWRLYDDAGLDALVEAALRRNTDLRQAEASLLGARAALSQARAGLLPTTTTSGGATFGRTIAAPGSAPPKANWNYDAAFDASYEVDLFGRVRRAIEAARADVEALAAADDLVRVDVAAETVRAYASACTYAAQADVDRRSLRVATETLDLTLRQRDLGSASDFEVANARTLVEQTRAPIPSLEASRRSSLYALAVLTGATPEAVSPVAAACRTAPRLIEPLPTGDGAALIRRRPDVREAERRLAAATATIGVATAALYPSVSLGGALSTEGRTPSALGARASTAFSLGPLVSWSFPNFALARAQIAAARASAQVALAAFDGVVLTALQNVEQTLAIYAGELDHNAALRAARDQAAESYRLADVRLQAGSISFVDILTIQRTLIGAEQALAASDAAVVDDQISAFMALGGGWSDVAPVSLPPLPVKGSR